MRSHPYRRLETRGGKTRPCGVRTAELKLPLLGYMVREQRPATGAVAGAGSTRRDAARSGLHWRRIAPPPRWLCAGTGRRRMGNAEVVVIGADGAEFTEFRQMAELAFMLATMRSRVCLSPSEILMRGATAPGSEDLRQRVRAFAAVRRLGVAGVV